MFDHLQLDSCGSGELWVESQYVDCKLNFVDDALSGAVPAGKQFEIWKQVVLPVAVLVVNCFLGVKVAAEVLAHHVAMFHDGVLLAGNKRGDGNPNVAVAFNVSSVFAALKFFKSEFFAPFVFAFAATVFLFSVQAAARFSRLAKRFIAVCACEGVSLVAVFSATNPRTFSTAVKRVSAVFFVVLRDLRTNHPKRRTAFAAVETDNFSPRRGYALVETKRASTTQTTKAAVVAWVAEKRFVTFFTNLLDRHGWNSLFGDKVVLAVPFVVVK